MMAPSGTQFISVLWWHRRVRSDTGDTGSLVSPSQDCVEYAAEICCRNAEAFDPRGLLRGGGSEGL